VEDALRRLDTLAAAAGNGVDVPTPAAIHYLAGRMLQDAGRMDAALLRYASASRSELSDAALLKSGSIRLQAGDTTGGRAAFAGISPASSDWEEARLALASALVREGRPSLAISVLKDLFRDDLRPPVLHRARLSLGLALDAAGERSQAGDCLLAAYLHAPDSATAKASQRALAGIGTKVTRLEEILRDIVRADGPRLRALARWARSHSRAAKALDPGLKDALEGAAALAARQDSARQSLENAVASASSPLLRACAETQLAQALAGAGQDDAAVDLLRKVLDSHPRTPFAAQAALSAGRSLVRLGDYPAAVSLLARISRDHPESGLDPRSRWEMALAGLLANRPDAALAHIDEVLAHLDRGDGVPLGLVEKMRYFRGSTLLLLGRRDEGLRDLRRVARNAPYTYYGVLAASRLSQEGAAREPFRTGWLSGPRDPAPGIRSLRVCGRALGPVLLWRLGYGREALEEMKSRAELGLLDEDHLLVLAAMIADSRPPKQAMYAREYLRGLPTATTADLFALAYPRPFAEDIEAAVAATGEDPALILGVMRAESAFQPGVRSVAGAVGLMQVLPSSGRLIASRILKDPRAGRALWAPKSNILLGSAFLADLGRHFQGHLPLVLTGYNAGPGAARKFLKRFGSLKTDLFVESIPYPVTAAYVKHVIGYAAGYRAMYDSGARGPLNLRMDLPQTLGPFLQPRPRPGPGSS
jgi:soluble lytic murein transglycosylase